MNVINMKERERLDRIYQILGALGTLHGDRAEIESPKAAIDDVLVPVLAAVIASCSNRNQVLRDVCSDLKELVRKAAALQREGSN